MHSNPNSTFYGPNTMPTIPNATPALKRTHGELDNKDPIRSFLDGMQRSHSSSQDADHCRPESSRKRTKLSSTVAHSPLGAGLHPQPSQLVGNQCHLPSPAHSPLYRRGPVEQTFSQSQGQQQLQRNSSAAGSTTGLFTQSSNNSRGVISSNAEKIRSWPSSPSIVYVPQNGRQNPSVLNMQPGTQPVQPSPMPPPRPNQIPANNVPVPGFTSTSNQPIPTNTNVPYYPLPMRTSMVGQTPTAPPSQLQQVSDWQFVQHQMQNWPQYANFPPAFIPVPVPRVQRAPGVQQVQGRLPVSTTTKVSSRSIDINADIIMALIRKEVMRASELMGAPHKDVGVSTREDDYAEKGGEDSALLLEVAEQVANVSVEQNTNEEVLQAENARLKAELKKSEEKQQGIAEEIARRLGIIQTIEAENPPLKAQTNQLDANPQEDKTRTDASNWLILEFEQREQSRRSLEEENTKMRKELELVNKRLREETEKILKLQGVAAAERAKWEAERNALEAHKGSVKDDAKANESKSIIIQTLKTDSNKWEQDWLSLKRKNAQRKADLSAVRIALEEANINVASLREALDIEREKVKIAWKRSEVKKDHWLKIVKELESKAEERRKGAGQTPQIDSSSTGEVSLEDNPKLREIHDQLSKELESWKADYDSVKAENVQANAIVDKLENTIIKLEAKLNMAKVTSLSESSSYEDVK